MRSRRRSAFSDAWRRSSLLALSGDGGGICDNAYDQGWCNVASTETIVQSVITTYNVRPKKCIYYKYVYINIKKNIFVNKKN